MTKTAWAGALVAGLWASAAYAQECPEGTQRVVVTSEISGTERAECRPVAQGQGASPEAQAPASVNSASPAQSSAQSSNGGVGGSGSNAAGTSADPSSVTVVDTTTTEPNSAASEGRTSSTTTVVVPNNNPDATNPSSANPAYRPQTLPPAYTERSKKKAEADMTGLTLMAGAGVEAYAGALGPRVRPGAAWSVLAAIKPTRVFGVELGYTGAANDVAAGGVGGPDIVRNGGRAQVTFGFTSTAIQPYALAGIGIDRYDVRGGQAAGFRSDTSGAIPVGGGVRAHFGHFTADARGGYDFTFNQDFATGVGQTEVAGSRLTSNAGRYMATLNLGGTF